jgi:hypothetical protein
MKRKLGLELRPANRLVMQLICNCCGQPYYPDKSWEDRIKAIIFGAEKYAICPLCTQAPPQDVFESLKYRLQCSREVSRLQRMYEKAQKTSAKGSV